MKLRSVEKALSAAGLLGILVCAGVAAASPLPQQETLGEAARRLRQQKRAPAKPERRWDNQNLPGGQANVVGVETPGSAPSAAATRTPPSPEEEKERGEAEAALNAEKEKLGRAKTDLDLLERDYNLKRQQVYSSADYASDTAGKSALAQLEGQMAAKKQEIQETEQKVAEKEAKLKEINERLGPKDEPPPTPDQQRAAWAARLRPLRDELAQIDAEIRRVTSESTARANVSSTPPLLQGTLTAGQFSSGRLGDLQKRREELLRQIAELEEEARRAGFRP